MNVILLPTYFGRLRDNLQGGEDRNTVKIIF